MGIVRVHEWWGVAGRLLDRCVPLNDVVLTAQRQPRCLGAYIRTESEPRAHKQACVCVCVCVSQ